MIFLFPACFVIGGPVYRKTLEPNEICYKRNRLGKAWHCLSLTARALSFHSSSLINDVHTLLTRSVVFTYIENMVFALPDLEFINLGKIVFRPIWLTRG